MIWGSAEIGIIKPLFILQKKALRIVNRSHYLDHTSPIFKSLETLTIYQIYESNFVLFAFKCIHFNMLPFYRNYISQNLDVHTYNTRNNDKYRVILIARLRVIQRSY